MTFTFAAAGSVASGTYTGTLVGTTALISRTFPFTVTVAPAPDSRAITLSTGGDGRRQVSVGAASCD